MPYEPGNNSESMYFLPVGKVCRRPPVLCSPDATTREAARLMQERNITCVVVRQEGQPDGIFTVRDLRRATATCEGNPADTFLSEWMTPRLITMREEAYLFDAISLMSRNNFHRVGVVDASGTLVGMLTDTDLLTFQTRTPLYLITEIERATTIEQLRNLNTKLNDMVGMAYKAGVEIHGVVQLIAHFNDSFTMRLIKLMESQEGIKLPDGAAYMALGSEGRHEQTLRTDQDSAIVYRDDFPPEQLPELKIFANRLIDLLEMFGVPRCPGNTMASNPQWCYNLSAWKVIVESWISTPMQDNVVNFGMFQDMRVLHGDHSLEEHLRKHIYETAHRMSLFFPLMARHIVRFKPPIGMFGRLKVEKLGANRGKLDLKKGGLFAIVRGISLIALEAGIMGGSTWDKLVSLRNLNLISPAALDNIEESFNILMRLRLGRQLAARAANQEADNCVDPMMLREGDREQLRRALRGVEALLKILSNHYQIDLLAR